MKLTIFAILTALSLVCCERGTATKIAVNNDHTMRVVIPAKDSIQTIVDTIHLGRVYDGEVLKSSFKVVNLEPRPVVIVNVITGCGCTTVEYDTKPIAQNEERLIEFTFDSSGRVGWQFKSIDVITADRTVARIFFEAQVVEQKTK